MRYVRIATRLMLPFGGMIIGAFGIYDVGWVGGPAMIPGALLILAATIALSVSVVVDKMDQARRVDERFLDRQIASLEG